MQHLNTEYGISLSKEMKKTHIYFQKIGISKANFFVSSSKVRHRVQSEFWSGTLWVYRGARGQNDASRWPADDEEIETFLFMPHMW